MSEHFQIKEFACKCGCGKADISPLLIDKLEALRVALGNNPITIVSGCRCSKHSVAVKGGASDMHTKGGAVDIYCTKPNGEKYSSKTIAEHAEKLGFTGIGIITEYNTHVDIRGTIPFTNNHWFGNEITGENYIPTFQGMGESIVRSNSKDVTEIECTIKFNGAEYSGKLTKI